RGATGPGDPGLAERDGSRDPVIVNAESTLEHLGLTLSQRPVGSVNHELVRSAREIQFLIQVHLPALDIITLSAGHDLPGPLRFGVVGALIVRGAVTHNVGAADLALHRATVVLRPPRGSRRVALTGDPGAVSLPGLNEAHVANRWGPAARARNVG